MIKTVDDDHEYEVAVVRASDADSGIACFDCFDDAVDYAEANGISEISGVGSDWTDYRKCAFCGEWVDVDDLDEDDYCEDCISYLRGCGEI